ncbi:hypothetical protein SAY87_005644 [Trapa incisa]|uniref:Pre-mRNA-splicing factor SLU7 n=1 Tax=Trapa incisa TaxID=236973 RepID=A0AAN7K681_9MYRT|nr:hypothetical protein SAY87_005644 [Trapa incisa]
MSGANNYAHSLICRNNHAMIPVLHYYMFVFYFGSETDEICGVMTHDARSCMDKPRKRGAKWTNMHIAPDEEIETFELDYDGKRDRWNGYDASTYSRVIERYEARDEAR